MRRRTPNGALDAGSSTNTMNPWRAGRRDDDRGAQDDPSSGTRYGAEVGARTQTLPAPLSPLGQEVKSRSASNALDRGVTDGQSAGSSTPAIAAGLADPSGRARKSPI